MRSPSSREARSRRASPALPIVAVLGVVAAAVLAVVLALSGAAASPAGVAVREPSPAPFLAARLAPDSRLPDASRPAAFPTAAAASPRSASSTPRAASVQPRAITAPSPSRPSTLAIREVAGVAFTRPVPCGRAACQVRLDVYAPSTPGTYPAVVLVRGGPSGMGGRTGLGAFARRLATQGHVVFNADMRDFAASGGGYPAAFDDVACAVRFARAQAARYGGDPTRVTLVGHSLGGWVGSVVAFGEELDDSSCVYTGSGRPDAFVGLAGNYDLTAPRQVGDLLAFFGGDARTTGAARAASDPFAVTPVPIPARLVAGTDDGSVDPAASISFEKRLEKFGLDSALTQVRGGTHVSIVSIAADGATSLAVIDQVADDLPARSDGHPREPLGLRMRAQ